MRLRRGLLGATLRDVGRRVLVVLRRLGHQPLVRRGEGALRLAVELAVARLRGRLLGKRRLVEWAAAARLECLDGAGHALRELLAKVRRHDRGLGLGRAAPPGGALGLGLGFRLGLDLGRLLVGVGLLRPRPRVGSL